MATVTVRRPKNPVLDCVTFADLAERLGVPAGRVRLHPTPGTATARDVVRVRDKERLLCELVDGTLVEKVMGFEESGLATLIAKLIADYLNTHDIGKVYGPDAMLRIRPGRVRLPDASFFTWERLSAQSNPGAAIATLVPDLAVEVLSKGNTRAEMDRKISEYFDAGTRLVWLVDRRTRTAKIYRSPKDVTSVPSHGALDGWDVLPGLTIPLAPLFAEAERRGPKR